MSLKNSNNTSWDFFFNFKSVSTNIVYKYIVPLYQFTSTSGGSLLGSEQYAERTAICVTFGTYV